MISFRNARLAETGLQLLVHADPEGEAANTGPVSHRAAMYTDVMKT
ncbi:hypothetical protein [Xanthomonas axonopodis]